VAAADPLLDALGVPGQVVVHDDIAELQVDALRGGLCGDDQRVVTTGMELLKSFRGRSRGKSRARVNAGIVPAGLSPWRTFKSEDLPLSFLPTNAVCCRTSTGVLSLIERKSVARNEMSFMKHLAPE